MKKVIVITGGSEGLGYEIAKTLSPKNSVIIVAHNQEKIEKAAKEIGCDFEFADVTNLENIKAAVESILKKYGRIDCLINNAGIWIEGELDTNDAERIKETLDVNVFGVIMFTKEVLPAMKKQKAGRIINISSDRGLYAKATRSVYCASKFAVTGFTHAMAEELAKDGIGVTAIYPSQIQTKLFESAGASRDLTNALEPNDIAKAIEFIVSLNPTAVVTDLAIKSIKQ